MSGIELNLGWLESPEPVPLSRFIGLERPRSGTGPDGSIFPRFPAVPKSPRSGSDRGGSDGLAFSLFPAGVFRVGRRRPFPWSPTVRVPSWRPSFGFSAIVLPAVLVVAGGGGPSGRVWEGATAPLPIERAVSEANSFLGGSGGAKNRRRTKVIHRRFFARAD